MWNAFTYLAEFQKGALSNRASTLSHASYTDAQALHEINNAQAEAQRRLKLSVATDGTGDIASGTSSYELPATRLDRSLRSVKLIDSQGCEIPLEFLSEDDFADRYVLSDLTRDAGPPRHWTFDRSTPGNILVRPAPDWTLANGIKLQFADILEPIEALYYSTENSLTVTTTKGLTTATASGQITSGSIAAGWEFGIVPTTNLGRASRPTTAYGDIPVSWYRLSAVGSANPTVFTLGSAYRVLGGSGLNFIAAQRPDIEIAAPGLYGFAVVHLALQWWFEGLGDYQRAKVYENRAEKALARTPSVPPFKISHPAMEECPWINPLVY